MRTLGSFRAGQPGSLADRPRWTSWWALLLLALAVACQRHTVWKGEVVEPRPIPELVGTNWDGQPFKLSDLRGRVAILFFGYTFCPDVCPLTLARMKELYARLGDRAAEVAVVFVSVDPHRDTVEKLSRYVPNFDRRFFGVHLGFDQLDATQESFDITVQYGQPKEGPGTDSYYYVDHTGSFFIVDREGMYRLTFPPNASVDLMLPDIELLLAS